MVKTLLTSSTRFFLLYFQPQISGAVYDCTWPTNVWGEKIANYFIDTDKILPKKLYSSIVHMMTF